MKLTRADNWRKGITPFPKGWNRRARDPILSDMRDNGPLMSPALIAIIKEKSAPEKTQTVTMLPEEEL